MIRRHVLGRHRVGLGRGFLSKGDAGQRDRAQGNASRSEKRTLSLDILTVPSSIYGRVNGIVRLPDCGSIAANGQ